MYLALGIFLDYSDRSEKNEKREKNDERKRKESGGRRRAEFSDFIAY